MAVRAGAASASPATATHMHADMHDVVSLLPDRSGLSFLNLEVRLIYVQVDSFSFVRS